MRHAGTPDANATPAPQTNNTNTTPTPHSTPHKPSRCPPTRITDHRPASVSPSWLWLWVLGRILLGLGVRIACVGVCCVWFGIVSVLWRVSAPTTVAAVVVVVVVVCL